MLKISIMGNSNNINHTIMIPKLIGVKNVITEDSTQNSLKKIASKNKNDLKSISLGQFKNNKRNYKNLYESCGICIDIINDDLYKIHIPSLLTFLETKQINYFYIDSVFSKIKHQKGHLCFLFKKPLTFKPETKKLGILFSMKVLETVFDDFKHKEEVFSEWNINRENLDFCRVIHLSGNDSFYSFYEKGHFVDAQEIMSKVYIKNNNITNIGEQAFWQMVKFESITEHLEKSMINDIKHNIEFDDILKQAQLWNGCLSSPLQERELKRSILSIWNKEKSPNVILTFKELITKYCTNIYDVFFDVKNKDYTIIFKEENNFIKLFKKIDFKQFLMSELVRHSCKINDKKFSSMLSRQIESKELIYNPLKEFGTFIEFDRQFFNICVLPEHAKYIINDKFYNNKCNFCMLIIKNLVSEKYIDNFINWMAVWYQTRVKSRVSWVIKGVQGSGKGLLCEVIIPLLFGFNNCTQIGDGELESDFNEWAENKMFINMDEVTRDYLSRGRVKNKIKKYITAENCHINRKNTNRYTVINYANYIITSNEAFPIDIEIGDRRFIIVETYKKLKNEKWFFEDEFGKTINDPIAKIKSEIESFAHYLANYKIDKVKYNLVFETSAKIKVLEGTMTGYQIFIEKLFNKDMGYFEEELGSIDFIPDYTRTETYIKLLRKAFNIDDFIKNSDINSLYNFLFFNKNKSNSFITRKIKNSKYGSKDCQKRFYGKSYRGYKLTIDN